MPATETAISRTLRVAAILAIGLSLTACGGDDDMGTTPPPDPQPIGDDDDDDNDKPTAEVAFTDSVGAKELLTINFSEAMDKESLTIGGTLAPQATPNWESSDSLQLAPGDYWKPGTHTLEINADDSEGLAMDTLQVNVTVRSTFSTFQAASVVIGQQDFTGGYPRQDPDGLAAGANTLDRPSGAVDYVEEKDLLYIADTYDSRVLGFRGIPGENNANADFVIGQPDFTTTTGETSQQRVRRAEAVTARAGALLIADPDSHRVTVYNELPESGPGQADVVLGQENFEDFNNACEPHRINHVHNQFVTPSGRLMVADANNNRILVWNEVPEVTGELPDLVIGQQGLDQCVANDDNQDGFEDAAPSARTLRHPVGIWSDDERLVVVDNYNNRVLLWHKFPEDNFAPADVVLGQLSMNSNVPNDDDSDGAPDAAPTARVVDYPWSVWFAQNQLFVTDAHNHRVLVWNGWPEESSRPADSVLGQDAFNENLPNAGNDNPSAQTLNSPMGVRVVDHELLVTDTENSRVLIFRPQFE